MIRTHSLITRLCAVPLVSLMAIAPAVSAEEPVKVYILAGQSNMAGIFLASFWGSPLTNIFPAYLALRRVEVSATLAVPAHWKIEPELQPSHSPVFGGTV